MFPWWIWPVGLLIGFLFGAVTPPLFEWVLGRVTFNEEREDAKDPW
jgi:hypothetical protein